MRRSLPRIVLLLPLLLHTGVASAQLQQVQSIPLYTGWNLISFQVNPTGFTPQDLAQGLGTNAYALIGVWGYDPVTRAYQVYQPTNSLPAAIASLQRLYPGKGYWVKMSKGCVLQLSGSPWNGSTMLLPGWNLVGFPGLSAGPAGKTDFASIFRSQMSSVPVIWTFQGGTLQRFVGYDTLALPTITGLTGVQPGQGYWVYSTATLVLAPTAAITLPPDSASPRGPTDPPLPQPEIFQAGDPRYTGTNAALYANQIVRFALPMDAANDLNHNGILDSPYTQDTMFFVQGVNRQNLTLFNTGSGLMNWYIVSSVPWLTINPPAGATTTEPDSVQLTVDRSGLKPGFYTNTFTICAASTVQTVTVVLQVPTIAGDYKGYATTQRVNGNTVSIGTVDLNLSLFDDPSQGAQAFRGVINSDQSLLFPSDVFMNGIFYQGLNFSLTTSFPMAPADRDAPPYNSFHNIPPGTPGYQNGTLFTAGQTILPSSDVNSNGILDANNIFPFTIRREITLLGARTTADHLEGTYVEAISGPLPAGQRIYIEGAFVLDRQTLVPTIKSIYNAQSNTTVIIGGSAHSSYTTSICVGPAVQIQGATVNLNFNFSDPTQLDVILYAPGHTRSYDFGTNVGGLTTFALTNFNNSSAAGCWDLVINWNPASGLRGYFNGWGLNLDGLAYYSVTGSVVTVTTGITNPVSGATLALSGSNILPQSNTSTNGGFSFSGLTENEYYLTVSKLGYSPATVTFFIEATNVSLAPIVLTPLTAPTPVLSAQPSIGQAPLNVNFTPIISPDVLTALGSNVVATWNFGDGSAPLTTPAFTLSYIYTNGGSYKSLLTLTGSAGTTNLTCDFITALAAAPNTSAVTNPIYAFGGGFIGSIASRSKWQEGGSGDDILVTTNAVWQESKRDSATFDFYRNPYGRATGEVSNLWDTTFWVQDNTPYAQVGGTINVPASQQFRMISTLGGYVFPTESATWTDNSPKQGDFVLQSGRIED